MREKIISVSKAKAKLLELTRHVSEEGYAYVLTKDGEAVSALIPLKDYEELTETLEIFSDQESLKNLNQALEDEKKSRLWKRDAQGKWIKVKKTAT